MTADVAVRRFDSLTSAAHLGRLPAPSAVVFGPHETNLCTERRISERHVAYYRRRAAGGAGVIVTEEASVHDSDWPYERAPLARDCPRGWEDVAAACHEEGSLVIAALGHAGSQGSSAYHQRELWGASSIPDVVTREVPKEMERADIGAVVRGFGDSTALAVSAGCDGVEVNAGQWSLLRQFCSGLTNARSDEYGTDRSLLLREVLAEVRRRAGPAVVGLRFSCDELAPWAGLVPEAAASMLKTLQEARLFDYVTVVRGSAYDTGATRPDGHTPEGFNRGTVAAVRAYLGSATALVAQGSVVDPALAEQMLAAGEADLVEMTRALIADADLVRKCRRSESHHIRPCVLCNQACQVRDPRNPLVSCTTDPRSGHEWQLSDPLGEPPRLLEGGPAPPVASRAAERSEPPERLLVVGAGPAGLECARFAALGGFDVTVLERQDLACQSLRAFARLPGRHRFALLAQWLEEECRSVGAKILLGHEATVEELDAHDGPVVIATGSRAGRFAYEVHAPGTVESAADVLRASVPFGAGRLSGGSIAVWDPVGGPVGTGIAELLATSGAEVTLVTPDLVAGDQLGRTGDLAPANVRLKRLGATLVTRSVLRSVEEGRAVIEDRFSGERRDVGANFFVDAGHRLPEDALARALTASGGEAEGGRSGRPRVQVVGDCIAPRTVLEALLEGRRAALSLLCAQPSQLARGTEGVRMRDAAAPSAPARTHPRARHPLPARAPSQRYPLLFSPLRLGPVTLENRIVFAAHLTNYASDGLPSEQHAAYYAARARGGAGLIITEEHSTHPTDWPYEKLIHAYNPAVVPGYRRITEAVHAYGTPIFAQLNHNGGQGSSMYSRLPVWAPSAIADHLFREVPHAVSSSEIRQVIAGYTKVAGHCLEGGFDGVELQCSHSSMVRGFLSSATNMRADEWGGSIEGRARLLLQLLEEVREAIGPDMALGVRLCGDELIEGGTTIEDAVAVAKMIEQQGCCDYVNTSIGVATATLFMIEASMHVPPGYATFIPSAIREAVSLPVVGVGRFKDPLQAERALEAGHCDLVGVVRGQIADPDFARKARAGRPESIRLCLSCNQECVGRMGLNRWLGCIENPAAGKESARLPLGVEADRNRSPAARRRAVAVAVAGAGPAGLEAAVTAARHGASVVVFEQADEPGGLLRLAASVPNRAELGDLVRNLLYECKQLGVDLRTRTRATTELLGPSWDTVVVATGSRPRLPHWAEAASSAGIEVADVRDVLSGAVSPVGRVVVVDETGFHEATSISELLADRGCEVTVMTPGMVVGQDLSATLDLEGFNIRAAEKGIIQLTDRVVMGAGEAGLEVLYHPTGAMERFTTDWVVLAVPALPDDALYKELVAAGSAATVTRIGDCLAPRRAHAAVLEGERAGALVLRTLGIPA